jgi:predicted acylesterase/phospholipase RssA
MSRPSSVRNLALAGLVFLLGACAGGARGAFDLEDRGDAAPMGLTSSPEAPIRFYVDDDGRVAFFQEHVRKGLQVGPDGQLDLLAVSGGGANGAFTAGVMSGWTQSGERPDFEIVTGVSTGALAAPFIFLGPDWDDELTEAYVGGAASALLRPQGLGALFGSGIYQAEPLRELIASHVDMALLEAVAAEARKGRVLLVATTDLDSQRGVSWDMGAIAMQGGPAALELFRTVLQASASIPGAFPPVRIRSVAGGLTFEEMHVDGGVTVPFLGLPESLWTYQDPTRGLRGARLHVIVNGRVAPSFAVTTDSLGSVLGRSLDTMLRASMLSTLAGNRAFADRNGLVFRWAALPDDSTTGSLDFSPESMRAVYELGRQGALDGSVWR